MVMTVRFGEGLWERLETYCLRSGATKNAAVLIALEQFLAGDSVRPDPVLVQRPGTVSYDFTPPRSAGASEVVPDWKGGKR